MLHTAFSAAWRDPRSQQFPKLYEDPNALCEIEFMLLPVFDETRSPYDPQTHGIIAQQGQLRATFLPKVFDQQDKTEDIKRELLDKAGIQQHLTAADTTLFYLYKVMHYSCKIKDLLNSR